jgi:sugar lactone lactonase YvrE
VIEPVTAPGALLGESPVWHADSGSLLWVDILRGEVHCLGDDGADEVIVDRAPPVSAVVVRARGGLLLTAGMDVVALDGAGEAVLATADRGDRLNEARCDPAGRLWTGTMSANQQPGAAALYRLDPATGLERMVDGVAVSNGTGWSPDGTTMYYADTVAETVDAFDYDVATGTLSGRRRFVELHDALGRPDGLSVDVAGGVWVAMARGWAVRRFHSDGSLDCVLDVPCMRVTSCAFGGPDLTDLFVTTASEGVDRDKQPLAGAVFRAAVGVAGLPLPPYAG